LGRFVFVGKGKRKRKAKRHCQKTWLYKEKRGGIKRKVKKEGNQVNAKKKHYRGRPEKRWTGKNTFVT